MIIVRGNSRFAFASLAVSLIIFAVIYFTVISPDQHTANQVLKNGLQQSQQAIQQSEQQLNAAGAQSGTVPAQSKAAVTSAKKKIAGLSTLASCVEAAGTNVSAVETCQTKYAGN